MFMEKINTPVCLSVSRTKTSLETTLLKKDDGAEQGSNLLFCTFHDNFEKADSTWIIEKDEESDFYRIRTYYAEGCISVQESDEVQKKMELVEIADGESAQLWNLQAEENGLFRFESVAYQENFLSKVFSEATGDRPLVMLSPEKEDEGGDEYVLGRWYLTEVNQIFIDGRMLSAQKINPAVVFRNTTLDFSDEKECFRKLDKKGDSGSLITIRLNIPVTCPAGNEALSLVMGLEHFGAATSDNEWTSIDISVNGNSYSTGYKVESAVPWLSQFTIDFEEYSSSQEIVIRIMLSEDSLAAYWIRNIFFHVEGINVCYEQFSTHSLQYPTSGLLYTSVSASADRLSIVFDNPGSRAGILFSYPDELADIPGAFALIALNHAFCGEEGKINMMIDDMEYLTDYDDLKSEEVFSRSYFQIPLDKIGRKNLHRFTVSLSENSGADYLFSDAAIKIYAPLPEVNQDGYDNYVKSWVLSNRKNIAELNQIPRDDMDAWEFIKNAPAWFYLPYLPASPAEIAVLLKHYPLNFIAVAFEVKDINSIARRFRSDLLHSDIVRKNAYRHSYWMALLTNHLGQEFAYDLGNAHESSHVDLTIEGPFDHVTDKINNLTGIHLGLNYSVDEIPELLNTLWDTDKLAWCKNFRVENDIQIADVNWQLPLDYLYEVYDVQPEFDDREMRTLENNNTVIHGSMQAVL